MKIQNIVKRVLREDVGTGDKTTLATVPDYLKVAAIIVVRENGIISGLDIAKLVFETFDKNVVFEYLAKDGDRVKKDQTVARVSGKARSILTCERAALNFLQRMSGIATLTSRFVKKASSKKIKILDTRKTTPTLRALEKYAVLTGGGHNHRFGLYDGVLIKDNHIKIAGGIEKAVSNVRKKYPRVKVEVEAQSLKEVNDIMGANFKVIMLDNMNLRQLKKAIKIINGRYKIEVSGGVKLKNIDKIAKLNIDYISVGALTHSAKALNMSLDIL